MFTIYFLLGLIALWVFHDLNKEFVLYSTNVEGRKGFKTFRITWFVFTLHFFLHTLYVLARERRDLFDVKDILIDKVFNFGD